MLAVRQELGEAVGSGAGVPGQPGDRAGLAAALRNGDQGPVLVGREEDRAVAAPAAAARSRARASRLTAPPSAGVVAR